MSASVTQNLEAWFLLLCRICHFLSEKYQSLDLLRKDYSNSLSLLHTFPLAMILKICGIKIIAFMP